MDLYEACRILDTNKNATQEDIRSAYRKLAKIWHPDINKRLEATEKFKKINQAYDFLCKNSPDPAFGATNYADWEIFIRNFQYKTPREEKYNIIRTTLTLNLDDFPQGTAERIIKVLAANGITINKYNIERRS